MSSTDIIQDSSQQTTSQTVAVSAPPIRYCRGKAVTDQFPELREAVDFATFQKDVLDDRAAHHHHGSRPPGARGRRVEVEVGLGRRLGTDHLAGPIVDPRLEAQIEKRGAEELAGDGQVNLAGTHTLRLASDLTLPSVGLGLSFGGTVTVEGVDVE